MKVYVANMRLYEGSEWLHVEEGEHRRDDGIERSAALYSPE